MAVARIQGIIDHALRECNQADELSLPLVSPLNFDEETFVRAIITNLEWHRRVVYHVARPQIQPQQSVENWQDTCQRCKLSEKEALQLLFERKGDKFAKAIKVACDTEVPEVKEARLHLLLILSRFGQKAFLGRAKVAGQICLDEDEEAQIDACFIAKAWRTTCRLANGDDADAIPAPNVVVVGSMEGIRGFTGSNTVYVSSDFSRPYQESTCGAFDLFLLLINEFAHCKARIDNENVNYHSPLMHPQSEPELYPNQAPPIAPEIGCTFERKLFRCRPTFYSVLDDDDLPMELGPLEAYLLHNGPEPVLPIDLSGVRAMDEHKRDDYPISLDVSTEWLLE